MATINVNKIITDLNSKADIQLGNLSNTGKEVIANLGMPSSKSIGLTLGASGAYYTAPADGWVSVGMTGTNSGVQITTFEADINILTSGIGSSANSYYAPQIIVPIKKNDKFRVDYFGTAGYFKFIYAEGSKHLAS